MKTKQLKGKRLGASLLTLALFSSSFGCVSLTAKAENEPLDLYYISDSSEPIYDELLEEICGEYENRMEINLTSLAFPDEVFENLFFETNFFLDKINSDSLVILDIRNSIRPMPNDDDTWADYLLNFFQSVKDENCRTMFICGTDEARFNDDTEFLDYVDVHINTDLTTPFMYNILKDMEDREENISDVSLIFDQGFSYAIDTFILPLLRAEFGSELSAEYYPTPESVWNWLNENAPHININLYPPEYGRLVNKITGEEQFFGSYYDTEEIYDSFDKPIYAIGNNYYNDPQFQQFVVDMKETLAYMEMPAYMLIQGAGILGEICPIEYFQALGMYESTFQEYLKEMVFGFIDGDDLSDYSNWQGRCYVTFKPIEWGTDGWKIRTYDHNDLPEGWQVVMDPETYRFYYGEE